LVESSPGAKDEFVPLNPLPFQIAKLVHHKGEEMCKLRGPTFYLLMFEFEVNSFKILNLIIMFNTTNHLKLGYIYLLKDTLFIEYKS